MQSATLLANYNDQLINQLENILTYYNTLGTSFFNFFMPQTTFRTFLKGFIDQDSIYGDLASDALPPSAGWNGTTYNSLQQHLSQHNASPEAKQALQELIKLYNKS